MSELENADDLDRMAVTLFIGRHGETKLNSEERLRSWIDEPLNADGIKEAHAMAERMKKIPLARIYTSDLDRADHTAQIVAKEHGLKPIPRMWFRPLNFGDLNGKSIKEIQPKLDALNKIWETDPDHEAPGGESFSEFQDRNMEGLQAVMRSSKDGEEILIVAHLRNALLFHGIAVTGGPLKGESVQMMAGKDWHLGSGDVAQFEYDPGSVEGVYRYIGILGAKAEVPA